MGAPVQSAQGHQTAGALTVTLGAAPTAGNLLTVWLWGRATAAGLMQSIAPAGFTEDHYIDDATTTGGGGGFHLWVGHKVAGAGESASVVTGNPAPATVGMAMIVAEWSGLDAPDVFATGKLVAGSYSADHSIGSGSSGQTIGIYQTATDIGGRETVISAPSTLVQQTAAEATGNGAYGSVGWADPGDPLTAHSGNTAFHDVYYVIGSYAETAPPPTDPGYTPPAPAKAILEIFVHDESASRWGTATWATGPATGTEGIWSAAGWHDVTPLGVAAHLMWGSRRPDRGILADQDAATWNVQTYDPDRSLDPGNPDSPYYPQLLPGLPIRISHGSTVIRTGYCDEITYAVARPDYQGQIIASDTIGLLAQADVPADSILGDTLVERINDAIVASGIGIGGIPLNPKAGSGGGPFPITQGPPLSARPTGTRTVWDIVKLAAREVLWVPYITASGDIRVRAWGAPLDRGREITDPMLIDLTSKVTDDGVVSVVRVNNATGTLTIERVAAPLPRYGRRALDRTEKTIDPESWADAILADRAWPGVTWIPGTIRPRTAADVDYLGTLEIMERITLTVAGIVSVQGRILGAEMWVQHRERATDGASWSFRLNVATDGSTAVGTTTLVADVTGDTLVDDDTGTDYLEAD